jgi:hypothetical protein
MQPFPRKIGNSQMQGNGRQKVTTLRALSDDAVQRQPFVFHMQASLWRNYDLLLKNVQISML